jgi:hypothetical protein
MVKAADPVFWIPPVPRVIVCTPGKGAPIVTPKFDAMFNPKIEMLEFKLGD